jgi:MYXO-CTERM domain-containing protein
VRVIRAFARAVVVSAVALSVSFAGVGPARAFCRTMTTGTPPGYNPVTSGCWDQGRPLAWTAGHIPYQVAVSASKKVSLADATRVARLAFETWNHAACQGAAPPAVQMYDGGPISAEAAASDCGLVACGSDTQDPHHVIVFDDDQWPHNDPYNTLALTTVTYDIGSAEIFDADIEVNSHQHAVTADEPPVPGTFDLQAILTHEAGHFLGMAHTPDSRAIMYAQYQPGAIQLTQDDLDAVCSTYPPPPSAGCSCASGAGQSGWWAMALGVGALVLATVRKRRRRALSR